MGEICEICGREKVKGGGTWNPSKCDPDMDAEHWRLGYERSQEALAVARRECEGLRTALNEIIGATDDDIAEKIARAALASPADGDSQ